MPENLTTKQFVDLETGRPVSNPCYIGDIYDADGADAVLRLFGRDKTRDVTGRVGDYRFTDDSILAPNHLWADGSPIDPVAWPELHAYAARLGWPADVQGHFLLPDLRGKFLVGADGRDADFAAGAGGGAKTVALTGDNNGPHVHGLSVAAPYAQPSSAVGGMSLGDAGVARETISSGKGIPFSILPPYRAVYVQIRAKPDPVVAQNVPQPNLLDNSNFLNPVNQRGQSSYTGTGGYCIDRWRLTNGSYTVATQQLVLTPTGTGRASASMQEFVLWKDLWKEGDTLTLSAGINGEVFSVTGVFPVWAGSSNCYMAVDISADYELASWRSSTETKASAVIQNKEGHSAQGAFMIDWIKLEKGSVATPYAPKGYGAELAECMRYYIPPQSAELVTEQIYRSQFNGALHIVAQYPVPMRGTPIVSVRVTYQKNVSGAEKKTVSAITMRGITPYGFSGFLTSGEGNVDYLVYYTYSASADL